MLADAGTRKILHNAKFDLMWMIAFCPDSEEDGQIHARNIQDTMLKSQIVNKYRTRSGAQKAGKKDDWVPNDLRTCLERYLGITIWKEVDHETTDWTGHWSDEMVSYMLDDIDHMEALNLDLDLRLQSEGQERAAAVEMDVVFGTAWMSLNGLEPDIPAWQEQVAAWRDEHGHLLWHLRKMWPGVDNFNSPKQIMAAAPHVVGGQLKSTRKSILKQLAPEVPPLAVLLDQRTVSTRLKNWGPTFLRQYVCGVCARFHPSWNQIGTETARFSCSRPNAQQFPRAPEFRRMIKAREGHLLASLDYSAIEVVAAAVLSKDQKLLEACRTGDPHLATAKMISGDPTMTKADPRRQNAKIANFGLLFGGGARSLVVQARDLFDVIISEDQAQDLVDDYFRLYTGMRSQRSLAYQRCQTGPEVLDVPNAIGFVRWLEGYNRKPTSVLNSRIQSDAGAGIKSTFRYLNEAALLPCLVGQIHDELLFEFPERDAEALAGLAKTCMLRGMQDVLGKRAPISIDTNIGRTWL